MRFKDFAKGSVDVELWFKDNGEPGEKDAPDSSLFVFHVRVFLARDVDLFDRDAGEAEDPRAFLTKSVLGVTYPDGVREDGLSEEDAGCVPQWAAMKIMDRAVGTIQVTEEEAKN